MGDITQRIQSLATEAAERLSTLEKREKQLDEAAAKIERSLQPFIKLNIGGKEFTTTIHTLKSQENSYFSALLSGRWEVKDTIFVDRDGTVFNFVLDFLRGEEIPTEFLSPFQLHLLKKDAEFYQLPALLNIITPSCIFSPTLKSPSIVLCDNDKTATVENVRYASYVLGNKEFQEGIHKFKIQLCKFSGGMRFGISTGTISADPSLKGTYGWGISDVVYIGGVFLSSEDGYKTDFSSGNILCLTLDCTQNLLTYRNETKNTEYSMDLPEGKKWRFFVNLHSVNDMVKIV